MRFRTALLALCAAIVGAQSCTDRKVEPSAPADPSLRFTTLVAGSLFTCGVDHESALWCWGSNAFGQLGTGDQRDRLQPVRVPLPSPSVRVTAGEARMCAIDAQNALRCWGDNLGWALADTSAAAHLTPSVLASGDVRVAATGSQFTCATDLKGHASCWGGDHYGELGDGGDLNASRVNRAPIALAAAFDTLVAGRTHACGLTVEGDAWCWGDAGLAGDGSREKRGAPVRVAGGQRFRTLTAGVSVTCGVATDSTAWCWGIAYDGQLGTGTGLENRFVPAPVSGGPKFRQLAAGHHHVCGLDIDGRAWCWGSNFNGMLGRTSRESSPVPVRVSDDRRYVSIASGDFHTCAIDTDGHAWCWGENRSGDGGGGLGDGSLDDRSTPTRVVPPLPSRPQGGP